MSDLHVVLVGPEIHWNTGNAGRTCLAAGATLHLVKPLGFSLEAKEVRRAGLDYWERVPLRLWESFEELERSLSELGEPSSSRQAPGGPSGTSPSPTALLFSSAPRPPGFPP